MYDFMESPRGYFLMYDFNFDPLPHLLSYYFHQKKNYLIIHFQNYSRYFYQSFLEEYSHIYIGQSMNQF